MKLCPISRCFVVEGVNMQSSIVGRAFSLEYEPHKVAAGLDIITCRVDCKTLQNCGRGHIRPISDVDVVITCARKNSDNYDIKYFSKKKKRIH